MKNAVLAAFCLVVLCLPVHAQEPEPWEPAASIPAPGTIQWGGSNHAVNLDVYGPGVISFYYNWTLSDADNDHGDTSWNWRRVPTPGHADFKGDFTFLVTAIPDQPGQYNVLLYGEYDPNASGDGDYLILGFNDTSESANDPETDQAVVLNDGQTYSGWGGLSWRVRFHTTP